MGLETGNFISALVKTNPLSSDDVSEGDDHLQLIKKILKQTFPAGTDNVGVDQIAQILVAKATEPTIDTSASGHAVRAMGLLWLDTSAGAGNAVLKMRNQANNDWVEFAISAETSKSVDINAGTIDGAIIGGGTPAAVTTTSLVATTADINAGTVDGTTVGASSASTGAFTTVTTTGALTVGADITISGDDIIMATNTDTYVRVADGTSYNPVAVSGDITITNAGVTSIGSDKVITAKILDANVTNAKLANMAGGSVKVRDSASTGVPSDQVLTTTQILIGDGAGVTAAALSGDVTMTNAGAVTVTKIQGEPVSSTTVANDQYLKYSSSSAEWQKVNIVGDDKLSTKGDLLVYNTADSETAYKIADSSYPGTDGYALTALAAAENGLAWQPVTVADNSITLAKLEDGTQGDILYYGASGAPARLGFGTSGDVLTTAGTGANPAWATPTTGDITGVGVTSPITGGGTSGSVTIAIQDASTSAKGAASFSSDNFAASSGAITIKDAGVASAELATGIDATKIADGTVTSAEFQYINTLSSNAQTQINTKGVGDALLGTLQTWTRPQIPATQTATISTSVVLDFDTYQNFILTLGSGVNTLTNPTTEASNVGQTGVMLLIQPSSGAAGTLATGTDYETVGGTALTLSSTNSQYDVVPYIIKATSAVLIGSPQLNFS